MTSRDTPEIISGFGQRRPSIEVLQLEDIPRLRLRWSSRYDERTIAEFVRNNPGLSLWSPSNGEYLIGGPWRHRSDITAVMELSASSLAVRLLDRFAEAAREAGKRLVIASEHHEMRRQEFYASAGYDLLEEIMIYDLTRGLHRNPRMSNLRFDRVDVANQELLSELMDIDRRAFPWLWWNSQAEFENYGHTPGVAMYIGRDENGVGVAYVGVTSFRSWGHLDRIAVVPEAQGCGYGLQALDWAIFVLAQSGARRIGLSTQARNERSRRLYERYGFSRVESQDYALYGRWLGEPEEI